MKLLLGAAPVPVVNHADVRERGMRLGQPVGTAEAVHVRYPASTSSRFASIKESGRSQASYRTKMRVPSRLTNIHRPCIYPSLENNLKIAGMSLVLGAVKSSHRLPTTSLRWYPMRLQKVSETSMYLL